MLREDPSAAFTTGSIEYLAGVLLIAAPFVLDFKSGAATALGIVAGVVVLAIAASSEGPTGMTATIPTSVHVLLDFALVAVLLAAPFVFSFSSEGAPTAFFLILGVAHLLVTIGTRFKSA